MIIEYKSSKWSKFLLQDSRMAWLWLIVRVYVGWKWFEAGWHKFTGVGWIGHDAGNSLSGFINSALAKTGGAHPDVASWYGYFLQHFVLPHTILWSYLVVFGEILIGIALITGIITAVVAFLGAFMNLNFMLAGSLSVNPVLFTLSILIIFAWRIAGYLGADAFILPWLKREKGVSPNS